MKKIIKHLHQSATLKLLGKAGLTLVAFLFVFEGVDFSRLVDMLRGQDHALLALAMGFMIAQMAAGAFRWRLILQALSQGRQAVISYPAAFRMYYISAFFTCCLPGTVGGDVVRVWLVKSDRVPMPLAIHSVIIDRLTALGALILVVALTLPFLGVNAGFNPLAAFPALVAAFIAGAFLLVRMERLIHRYKRFRVAGWALYFLDSLRLMLKQRTASCLSLMIALLAHVLYCLSAYALARSFDIPITALQSITLIPPVLLATTLPISIGGWGVREAAMIGMLGLIGIPRDAALMLSIQFGILIIAVSLPASLLWLLYRRRPRPSIHDQAIGDVP